MPTKSNATLIRGDIYKASFYQRLIFEFRKKIFRAITKNALPLFCRIGDVISISPALRGTYEPEMNALFSALCSIGFSDYLLDIGANIGLTTIQNGSRFKSLFAFEPNPTAFAILTANCRQFDSKHLRLHPFGIGLRDEVVDLHVPKGNMGGAYIAGEENSYSEEGFRQNDEARNDVVQVQIKCGSVILGEVFEALLKSKETSGVIKIDAEGYELTILSQIASSKREGIDFVAVFENWKVDLTKKDVLDIFAGNGVVYKLEWNMGGLNKIQQFMQLATQGERFRLTDSDHDLTGTVIYSTKSLL
jgi:FkbM family methyltransferase